VDVHARLDEAIAQISSARSLPMSASCVLNRPELIKVLEVAKEELPEQLVAAQHLVAERDSIIAEGRKESERIVTRAKRERDVLVSETEIAREARREADRILAKARRDAEETRRKADDYVDLKLATFEVVLGKTLEAVGRGRSKLMGRRPIDELARPDGHSAGPAVPRPSRPEPAAQAPAAGPPEPRAGEPEVEISGFFDTSVIDVEQLRKLHGDPDQP
jgi:vacuolar-type H+-ATPase subunit H